MNDYDNMLVEEQLYKAKLFQYPDWESPSAIFDFEDLENEEALQVLCARAKPDDEFRRENVAYVWHGAEHEVEQHDQDEFVKKCINMYFGENNNEPVSVIHERSADESAQFMHFLKNE